MLCHLTFWKFVSIYLSRYLCYPFGQTKRQWIFLSPKFLVFWTGNVYQDISLLVVVLNVEKNNGSFCHLGFFLSRYLVVGEVWCSKPEGAFCVLSLCFKIFFCCRWCSKPEKAFCYRVLCFNISLCRCGVVFKTRGDFLCFEFVFKDICLLAVVFKTIKKFFVIVFCVSIYLFVGVVFKTRGGFLLSLPATWDEPLFLPANGPIVQGAFRKYWKIEDDFDKIFKAHWKG